MSSVTQNYAEYIKEQSSLDRSLQGLSEFIQDPDGRQQFPVNIVGIDFARGKTHNPQPWRINPGDGHLPCPANKPDSKLEQISLQTVREKKFNEITTVPKDAQGRILLIEDVDRHTVAHLGERYNLPLSFFATYLTTELSGTEHEPQPPTIALAASKLIGNQDMHLNFQQVVDVGPTKQGPRLYFQSNVRRLLRPTPLLEKRCPSLARSCCSLHLCKDEKDKWICIILVDATSAELATTDRRSSSLPRPEHLQRLSRHASRLSDFRTWEAAQKLLLDKKEPNSTLDADLHNSNSLLHTLVCLFRENPDIANATNPPDLLSFAYFPVQLVIAEWMQYALLLSRYVKHYEYALISHNVGLKQSKVRELLPWRRRCIRSGHKLELLRRSVKHHLHILGPTSSEVQGRWKPILEDVDHVSSQLAEWATFLNSMVPLLDSHQSLIEAQSVRHLTYIVLVFSSLSLVASIFSMSEKVLPWGGGQVWLYFAVAVPLTAAVLGLYFFLVKILGRLSRG